MYVNVTELTIFILTSSNFHSDEIYLCILCDAGDNCYGISACIRYQNKGTNEYRTKLIYTCSRTTPSKSKLTILKKELCSLFVESQKGEYLWMIISIGPYHIHSWPSILLNKSTYHQLFAICIGVTSTCYTVSI